jgi:hypothetical protein
VIAGRLSANPEAYDGCSLSPRERVRVRGNGAYFAGRLQASSRHLELRETFGKASPFRT